METQKEFPMTQEGFNKLEKELEELKQLSDQKSLKNKSST